MWGEYTLVNATEFRCVLSSRVWNYFLYECLYVGTILCVCDDGPYIYIYMDILSVGLVVVGCSFCRLSYMLYVNLIFVCGTALLYVGFLSVCRKAFCMPLCRWTSLPVNGKCFCLLTLFCMLLLVCGFPFVHAFYRWSSFFVDGTRSWFMGIICACWTANEYVLHLFIYGPTLCTPLLMDFPCCNWHMRVCEDKFCERDIVFACWTDALWVIMFCIWTHIFASIFVERCSC